MIPKASYVKQYASAQSRFLQGSIERFFAKEFSFLFGPEVRKLIVGELVKIVEETYPSKDRLQPGQLLWNAVSIFTRPDSPHRIHVPVILTLVAQSDVKDLCSGVPMSVIAKKAVSRIIKEAYKQGAVLSMRDIGLFSWRHTRYVSEIRKNYEKESGEVLPHTGNIHDMGTCISHKSMIVRKIILEKKDPTIVARETNHSQQAVDRYLKDYHRVNTCYKQKKNIDFISQATGMSKRLVKQYIKLIEECSKRDLTCQMA
jgi:hypothetical protein